MSIYTHLDTFVSNLLNQYNKTGNKFPFGYPSDNKTHIIYVTINRDNMEYYIGKTSQFNKYVNDKYYGSGNYIRFENGDKTGKKKKLNEIRETYVTIAIAFYETFESLSAAENAIVAVHKPNPKCKNEADGGYGFACGENNPNHGGLSDPHKKKISISNSGANNHMWGKTGELSHTFGTIRSEESNRKQSESRIGKYAGKNAPRYGAIIGIDQRRRTSEKLTGKNNPRYDKPREKNVVESIRAGQLRYYSKNTSHWKGKKHKPESIEKSRQTANNRPMLECQYGCGKKCKGGGALKRHEMACSMKPI